MPYWSTINSATLAQGDFLPACRVPVIGPEFAKIKPNNNEAGDVIVDLIDLIVMTQSCDLEHDKAPWVACCPIHTLPEFEEVNPAFHGKRWEEVRVGRVEGLHLLAGIRDPSDNQQAMVVNFRQIFSLPVSYLAVRAQELGGRSRLNPPYLEHFSQAFARFFMRVGLPSSIPTYNPKK